MAAPNDRRRLSLYATSLVAGGMAGTSVDLLFFPIDTIKTRLQASQGFAAAGGFKGVYRGVGSVVVGSAPGAALFFTAYEQLKSRLPRLGLQSDPLVHLLSASGGEVVACLVRVPTEVVKSRQQTSHYGTGTSSLSTFVRVLTTEGLLGGLYRGFGTTVAREIPFCAIQFPLYERLKLLAARHRRLPSARDLPAYEAAACGSLAGAVAAGLTTPLDVLKTRVMLSSPSASPSPRPSMLSLARVMLQNEGPGAFWKGVGPRVAWIGLGGAVFLGVYEAAKGWIEALGGANRKPA